MTPDPAVASVVEGKYSGGTYLILDIVAVLMRNGAPGCRKNDFKCHGRSVGARAGPKQGLVEKVLAYARWVVVA